jgi:hypothetical protein
MHRKFKVDGHQTLIKYFNNANIRGFSKTINLTGTLSKTILEVLTSHEKKFRFFMWDRVFLENFKFYQNIQKNFEIDFLFTYNLFKTY